MSKGLVNKFRNFATAATAGVISLGSMQAFSQANAEADAKLASLNDPEWAAKVAEMSDYERYGNPLVEAKEVPAIVAEIKSLNDKIVIHSGEGVTALGYAVEDAKRNMGIDVQVFRGGPEGAFNIYYDGRKIEGTYTDHDIYEGLIGYGIGKLGGYYQSTTKTESPAPDPTS